MWPGLYSARSYAYELEEAEAVREAAAAMLDIYRNGYPEGDYAADVADRLETALYGEPALPEPKEPEERDDGLPF